jgi:hypothetical protein
MASLTQILGLCVPMIGKTVTWYEALHICDSPRVSEYHKRLCRETQHRTMYLLIERKCWITQLFLLSETQLPNIATISVENCELWGTNDIPEPVFLSTLKQVAELALPSISSWFSIPVAKYVCIFLFLLTQLPLFSSKYRFRTKKKLNSRFPWHSWKHREIVRTFSYTANRDEPREGNLKPELCKVSVVRNYSIRTTEKCGSLCRMHYWYQN